MAGLLAAVALGGLVAAASATPSQANCLVNGTQAASGSANDDTILCNAANTPASGAAFDAAGGADTVTIATGAAFGSLTLGTGADSATMSGGTLSGNVLLGESASAVSTDANAFTMSGGTVTGTVFGGAGVDTVALSGTARVSNISLLGGNDEFKLEGSAQVTGGQPGGGNFGVDLGAGDDTALLLGGWIRLSVAGGTGNDEIVLDGTRLNGISGGNDDDTIRLLSGTVDSVAFGTGNDIGSLVNVAVPGGITLGAGADSFTMSGGTIGTNLILGNSSNPSSTDQDSVVLSGGTVTGIIYGDGGIDLLDLSGSAMVGSVTLFGGNDVFSLSGSASVTGVGGVSLGAGDDTASLTGGTVTAVVSGDGGADALTLDGAVVGSIDGGADDDTMDVLSGTVDSIILGAGADSFTMSGGTIGANLILGNSSNPSSTDDDSVVLSGGTVTGTIYGDGGIDTVDLSGSAAVGSVTLFGGNDVFTLSGSAALTAGVSLGAGDDTASLTGGTVTAAVNGDGGADALTLDGAVVGSIDGGADDDTMDVLSGTVDSIALGAGADSFTMSGGTIGADLILGDSAAPSSTDEDSVILSGGTVNGIIYGDGGIDLVDLSGSATVGSVTLFGGNDAFTLSDSAVVTAGVSLGAGDDTASLTGGTVTAAVNGDAGADALTLDGAVAGSIDGGADDDTIRLLSGTADSITLGTGADSFIMSGGTIGTDLILGDAADPSSTDDDSVVLSGGTVTGTIYGDGGIDTVDLSGSATVGSVTLFGGNDVFTLSGSAVVSAGVSLGAGDDTASLTGGTVTAVVSGDGGADALTLDGAAVGSIDGGADDDTIRLLSGTADSITLGTGADSFTMSGGTIGADLILGNSSNPSSTDQDSVVLSGGTINGVIHGDGEIDLVDLSGSATVGSVTLFGGNDVFTLSGSAAVTGVGGVSLGAGDDTASLTGGTVTAAVNGDAGADALTLDGAAVGSIDGGADDDTFAWRGGTMASFLGGGGSDTATVSAVSYDGTQLLDGGAGGVDRLYFQGLQFTADATTKLTGWEEVHLLAGNTVGLAGTLQTGLLSLAAGSTLRVLGPGLGAGTPGERLAVTGNFAGGGTLVLEAALGSATQSTDHLVIGGDVTGQTTLSVVNATPGLGRASRGDGILLVEVGGTAAEDAFVLPDPIRLGAFVYDLDFGGVADANHNFYLVSSVVGSLGALFEGAAYLIGEDFARLPGLMERYAGRMPASPAGAIEPGAGAPVFAAVGPWLQIEGGHGEVEAESGDRYASDRVSVKLGFDAAGDFENGGQAVVGGYLRHARSEGDIDDPLGRSSLTPEGYGLGVTALYLAGQGSYVDLQASIMRVESEMQAGGPAPARSDVVAHALAASAELGHVFDLGGLGRLIPAAQFAVGNVSAPDFHDSLGLLIEDFGGTSQTGQLHLAWQSPQPAYAHLPALSARLGYQHEFVSVAGVIVDGEELKTRLPEDWAEAELGLDWAIGAASGLSLRASYGAAIGEDPALNQRLKASVSFQAAF